MSSSRHRITSGTRRMAAACGTRSFTAVASTVACWRPALGWYSVHGLLSRINVSQALGADAPRSAGGDEPAADRSGFPEGSTATTCRRRSSTSCTPGTPRPAAATPTPRSSFTSAPTTRWSHSRSHATTTSRSTASGLPEHQDQRAYGLTKPTRNNSWPTGGVTDRELETKGREKRPHRTRRSCNLTRRRSILRGQSGRVPTSPTISVA